MWRSPAHIRTRQHHDNILPVLHSVACANSDYLGSQRPLPIVSLLTRVAQSWMWRAFVVFFGLSLRRMMYNFFLPVRMCRQCELDFTAFMPMRMGCFVFDDGGFHTDMSSQNLQPAMHVYRFVCGRTELLLHALRPYCPVPALAGFETVKSSTTLTLSGCWVCWFCFTEQIFDNFLRIQIFAGYCVCQLPFLMSTQQLQSTWE